MAYTDGMSTRPLANPVMAPVVEYHDIVRWGPIFAGLVVSVVSQLLLSALGAVVGGFAAGEATASAIGTGIGIWAVISLLISLFLGGWTMSSSCGPMNGKTAMLNATIMWATTLVLSGWLLASGVSGTFGIAAANAGDVISQLEQAGISSVPSQDEVAQAAPNISSQEADDYAATASKGGLYFIVGTLLGLASALVGSNVGAKKPRAIVR